MTTEGLSRIQLAVVHRDPNGPRSGAAVTGRGGTLIVHEIAGWNATPSIFARRASDGAIVMVRPVVTTIVDRQVPMGCSTFAGGRAWFETVTYQLPPNDRYGGLADVQYVNHVEQPVYADRQADGSPCPPQAVD